jgi:dethiobiotin synthetase
VSLLIVSGTGTEVGKTVTTAAVAALACARGERVAVVKPAQTGELPGEPGRAPGDLAVVAALTGLDDLHELARYPDPLSPEAAARTAGQPPLDLRRAADHIAGLAQDRDLVIVEGAGGLLVRYDPAGSTIADLAAMLDAPVLVVAAAGLGTLNHTALTLEALAARKLACAGVVVGSWPADPGLAERCNLDDLPALAGGPLAGVLPEGLGGLEPDRFLAVARRSMAPVFGGTYHRWGDRGSSWPPVS